MRRQLTTRVRSALYALRGGFLLRPLAITVTLGLCGALVSDLEERFPAVRNAVPKFLFPSREDPQVAQVILTSIATSTMTVVSIVFAILLMTLTLASTQFSPRILVGFVRDHVTQWTPGYFSGPFLTALRRFPRRACRRIRSRRSSLWQELWRLRRYAWDGLSISFITFRIRLAATTLLIESGVIPSW